MKSNAILAAVFFLVAQAAPQNTRKAHSEAECKFSGGRSILVTYSLSEHVGSTRLRTTEELVTDGIKIPPGDYALHPTRDPRDNWLLEITKLGTSKPLRCHLRRYPQRNPLRLCATSKYLSTTRVEAAKCSGIPQSLTFCFRLILLRRTPTSLFCHRSVHDIRG